MRFSTGLIKNMQKEIRDRYMASFLFENFTAFV